MAYVIDTHFTLAGRGVLVRTANPEAFFRDCFGAVCDTKLKLGMTDAPSKSDIMN